VIGHALQGFAQACKSRISKPLSLLWLAQCCTVLRSRWYQSGINITFVSTFDQELPSLGRRSRSSRGTLSSTLMFVPGLESTPRLPSPISALSLMDRRPITLARLLLRRVERKRAVEFARGTEPSWYDRG
jgi:hypothetical protein